MQQITNSAWHRSQTLPGLLSMIFESAAKHIPFNSNIIKNLLSLNRISFLSLSGGQWYLEQFQAVGKCAYINKIGNLISAQGKRQKDGNSSEVNGILRVTNMFLWSVMLLSKGHLIRQWTHTNRYSDSKGCRARGCKSQVILWTLKPLYLKDMELFSSVTQHDYISEAIVS